MRDLGLDPMTSKQWYLTVAILAVCMVGLLYGASLFLDRLTDVTNDRKTFLQDSCIARGLTYNSTFFVCVDDDGIMYDIVIGI
jgi:hypothetical protein